MDKIVPEGRGTVVSRQEYVSSISVCMISTRMTFSLDAYACVCDLDNTLKTSSAARVMRRGLGSQNALTPYVAKILILVLLADILPFL
jgi:hypothetical protein